MSKSETDMGGRIGTHHDYHGLHVLRAHCPLLFPGFGAGWMHLTED
jgi:hypothetical protein